MDLASNLLTWKVKVAWRKKIVKNLHFILIFLKFLHLLSNSQVLIVAFNVNTKSQWYHKIIGVGFNLNVNPLMYWIYPFYQSGWNNYDSIWKKGIFFKRWVLTQFSPRKHFNSEVCLFAKIFLRELCSHQIEFWQDGT